MSTKIKKLVLALIVGVIATFFPDETWEKVGAFIIAFAAVWSLTATSNRTTGMPWS